MHSGCELVDNEAGFPDRDVHTLCSFLFAQIGVYHDSQISESGLLKASSEQEQRCQGSHGRLLGDSEEVSGIPNLNDCLRRLLFDKDRQLAQMALVSFHMGGSFGQSIHSMPRGSGKPRVGGCVWSCEHFEAQQNHDTRLSCRGLVSSRDPARIS